MLLVEVFLLEVFSFCSTFVSYENLKNYSNSVFENMFHKYKNAFNISKLFKKTFLTKRKYIIINQNVYYKRIYKHLYC